METRAEKLKQAGIKKYGSLEAYKEALAERGKKGGKNGTGDSKRRTTEHYRFAGALGGLKRGKNASL